MVDRIEVKKGILIKCEKKEIIIIVIEEEVIGMKERNIEEKIMRIRKCK